MKTLKLNLFNFSLLAFLMGILSIFLAYPAMAGPKQASSGQVQGLRKVFTFNGDNSRLIALSTKPEIVLFSKALNNPKYDIFDGNIATTLPTPFTDWIPTNVTGDSGYSFRDFTCGGCSPLTLPLNFHLNTAKLENTNMKDPNTGDSIFKIKDHPELGVSFQLGTRYQGRDDYLAPLNFGINNTARIGSVQLYFGNTVSIFFLLRAKLHLIDNSIPNGMKRIPTLDLDLGYIKMEPVSFKPKVITFAIRDNGRINVNLKTPQVMLLEKQRQCFLVSREKNKTVPLKEVKKSVFDNIEEIEGGEFRLSVSCDKTENQINRQWLFPRVMITFKGENGTNNNGLSDLLKTEKGNDQAKGVSLRIKRQNGTDTVKYGLDSPQMNNPGQFQLQKQPSEADKNAQETFKVYYVKDSTRGTLTEGKVNAAATFTMSYQ
ncbi:fimbrial protein [Haemophilus influenzae]|uniref:HafE fimbrial protein n=1 Tax=Haemophilus influenzae F3047 TaxID=935897 RepID=A0AAV2U5M6_HAEIF|nr:fimbrial protein [Haemophilus influenzae]QEQ59194.1 type 1 fimbrial protein [Haemophilus influenzae biotype aegyptius]CBY87426.1 hafE fimbrial protein [Haemophilus influenzae F3047]